jgi:hypothetical protein
VSGCGGDGTYSTYTNQTVPYPLPIYPGADEDSISAQFTEMYDTVEFLTDDTPAQVTAWHDEQLQAQGWEDWLSTSVEQQLHLAYPADADLPDHTLIFMAMNDIYIEGKTRVSLQINHSGG